MPSYATHRGGPRTGTTRAPSRARSTRSTAAPWPRTAARRRTLESEIEGEEVLLDGNAEAEGHEFFSLGAFSFSADGRLLAYSVDLTGDERFTLLVKDLTTGELLRRPRSPTPRTGRPGPATTTSSTPGPTRPGGRTSCCGTGWAPTRPPTPRCYTEPDERFWLGVDTSRDEAGSIIGAGSKLTSEYRLLRTDDPEGEPRVVAPRRQGVEYDVEPAGDRLLIVHNDGAEDFALAEAPLDATDPPTGGPCCRTSPACASSAWTRTPATSWSRSAANGLSGLHLIPRDERGDLLPGRGHRVRRAAVRGRRARASRSTRPRPSGSATPRCSRPTRSTTTTWPPAS